MSDIEVSGRVPLRPVEAFDVFVHQIDTWWPRRGVFPYSFAPGGTQPRHIRFEPQPEGRFYEQFADASECIIGWITVWEPPRRLAHTWRDPGWSGETTITVDFHATEDGAEVMLGQNGFAAAGVPELAPYYEIGNRQTFAGFLAHCRAIHELRALEEGA